MSRFNFNSEATIKRSSYTNNKSAYSTVGTCLGFLNPVTQLAGLPGLQTMTQTYQFQTDGDVDIVATDRLTINSVDYIVKGVRKYDMKRNYYIDCILELPIKNV